MKGKIKGKKAILITAAVSILAVVIAWCLGYTSVRSTIRFGCIEHSDLHSWSASYFYMDGFMERTIYPNDNVLNVNVKTESGAISIEIKDDEGETIFNESNIETGTFQVSSTSNRVVVFIRTEKHKGSFEISG